MVKLYIDNTGEGNLYNSLALGRTYHQVMPGVVTLVPKIRHTLAVFSLPGTTGTLPSTPEIGRLCISPPVFILFILSIWPPVLPSTFTTAKYFPLAADATGRQRSQGIVAVIVLPIATVAAVIISRSGVLGVFIGGFVRVVGVGRSLRGGGDGVISFVHVERLFGGVAEAASSGGTVTHLDVF